MQQHIIIFLGKACEQDIQTSKVMRVVMADAVSIPINCKLMGNDVFQKSNILSAVARCLASC